MTVVTNREQHRDVIGIEPTTDEAEQFQRFAIDPLRVVDDAQHRLVPSEVGDERQEGETDEKSIIHPPVAKPVRRVERNLLRPRKRAHAVADRQQQTMERRETEGHLRFDAGDPHYAEAVGSRDRVLQERGLSYAGLTLQHEFAAAARAGPAYEV